MQKANFIFQFFVMKRFYAIFTFLIHLLAISTFTFNLTFGTIVCSLILLISIVLVILFISKKSSSDETRSAGMGILYGTLLTIFIIATFTFWLTHSFSRG
jgi:hypothetical protein